MVGWSDYRPCGEVLRGLIGLPSCGFCLVSVFCRALSPHLLVYRRGVTLWTRGVWVPRESSILCEGSRKPSSVRCIVGGSWSSFPPPAGSALVISVGSNVTAGYSREIANGLCAPPVRQPTVPTSDLTARSRSVSREIHRSSLLTGGGEETDSDLSVDSIGKATYRDWFSLLTRGVCHASDASFMFCASEN